MLSDRLNALQSEHGLSDKEREILRALADAFTGFLAQVPPRRRHSEEFWEGKAGWLTHGASRTSTELLGLAATAADAAQLEPSGRLLRAGLVRRCFAGDTFLLPPRFTLTASGASRLLEGDSGTDALLLDLALRALEALEAGGETAHTELTPEIKKEIESEPSPLWKAPSFRLDPATPPPSLASSPPRPFASGSGPRGGRTHSASPEDPDAAPEEALFDVREAQIGFEDVILPAETLAEIRTALVQIRKHPLLVEQWGVGERYRMGRGLAFNFAGPAGTGKSITAEAVAKDLSRPLMTVKYSGLESKWIGETGKHVAAVFAAARRQGAVLFFDEADAIASRRTANLEGSGRHYNLTVNILLHELEQHEGIVIFATNLAANFDPAFERRIQSHVLFRMPDAAERERIWRAHLPPRAPLGPDVDLASLAAAFEMAGGDIRNAMLKAIHLAALADAPDDELVITHAHLEAGARAVLQARAIMTQSILGATDRAVHQEARRDQ